MPLKQKSEIEVTEDQLSEQQSQEAVEGEDGEGCESEGKVSHRDEKMEASESQDEYFVEVVSGTVGDDYEHYIMILSF